MAQTTIIVELTIIIVVVAEMADLVTADLVTAVDSAADSAVGGFG
ncbi:MAG: hypothetical protein ACLRZT_04365 [Clostridium paraputrificum]